MQVWACDAACGAAEAEAIALGDVLTGFYVDAREVHVEAHEAEAVIDDDAVAFVVERLSEDDGSGVAGVHDSARCGAEIHAFVYAG
jgi:hypothetical protein